MPTARADLPLAFIQQRFWYLDRMGAGAALHVSMAVRLRGALDPLALERALAAVAARHETLRTGFVVVDGRLVQRVEAAVTIPVHVHDGLGADPAGDGGGERAEETWVRALAARPFDLTRPPLLRADLARLGPDRHLLLLTMHHIVSDGLSMTNLLDELDILLAAEARGEPAALPPLPLAFGDHAAAERRAAEDADLQPALDWWRAQLADLPSLDLPTDRPRPAEQGWHADVVTHALSPALTAELRALARARGVTLTTLLLAAWQLLLGRLAGQTDFAVGMPVTTRTAVPLEPLIGPLMDVLVLRADLSGDPPFASGFLPAVAATLGGALAHQQVPFAWLVEQLDPVRDTSRHPFFGAMFNLATRPADARPFGTLTAEFPRFQVADTGVDLDLRLVDEGHRLALRTLFDGDLFDPAGIETLNARFACLLAGIVAEPDARLGDLPLMDEVERGLLLRGWDAGEPRAPETPCVQAWVAQVADERPDAVAVEDDDGRLTYAGLLGRAAWLARSLRARGLGRGDRVAVAVRRSVDLPVALLGVLGSGAACVPLDPRQPRARLAAVVEDAGPAALVVDGDGEGDGDALAEDLGLPAVALEDDVGHELDDDARTETDAHTHAHTHTDGDGDGDGDRDRDRDRDLVSSAPDDVAYVIHTSGSTGRPKGVVVSHGALAHLLAAMRTEPGLGADDVLLAVTTVTFDIALLELLGPLVAGGRVVVADEETASDGRRLAERLASSGATVCQATPSTWRLLLGADWPGDPALSIWCGGEALPRDLAQALLGRCGALFNLYGPTETCIWSLVERVVSEPHAPVTLGRPLPGTRAWVLDAARRPVPHGAVGELCLSGPGLAQGYWRRPEETAAAFVEHPFQPGERLYRTGDRACRMPDGRLRFLGRADRQVKLRGHRIELEEVEAVLRAHERIEDAVALVRGSGAGAELVAHVVASRGAERTGDDGATLRAWIGERLPRAYVPSWIAWHDALPRTAGGKLDRAALARHARPTRRRPAERVAPRSEHERLLAEAFAEALGHDDIAVDDNFFDLGGHSLLAVQVLHRIEERTGRRLGPGELLVQDLGQLAETLDGREPEPEPGLLARLGGLLGHRPRPEKRT